MSVAAMRGDAAFMAQLRHCNDTLLGRELAACEAILAWVAAEAAGGGGRRRGGQRRADLDQLRVETLAAWGLSGGGDAAAPAAAPADEAALFADAEEDEEDEEDDEDEDDVASEVRMSQVSAVIVIPS